MNDIYLIVGLLGGLAVISGYIFYKAKNLIPYVHSGAKTSAWKANLLTDARLDELSESPQIKQILNILEDTQYQFYISQVSREGGVDVGEVEDQLNSFLNSRYEEILEIVPEERKGVIEKTIQITNLRNLAGITIGASEEIPEENIKEIVSPSPTMSQEELEMLLSAKNLERLLEYLEGSEYYDPLSEALEERYEDEGISSLLRALDKTYYETLWEDIERKKAQRSVLKEIVGTKIDMMNIKLIFRLKREETPPERIAELLVVPYRLSEDQLKDMTSAEDIQSAAEVIMDTFYGPPLQESLNRFEETGSLFEFENTLDEEFLRICRRISISQPFSLAPVLTYIYLTETEVRNLRTIIGLKAEEIDAEKIKNNLIRRRKIEIQSAGRG
ncbi:hypothetical protein AKJ36_00795 [candidate division MSBL1 archaeon SCGC-AAA259I07]|uniref:V-type ATP synthase subunit C n=2 Tax=candidate division MSBL1 TaxID=215777 RepID=A0A133U6T9_9EURY|nr:hypothetical protein AKJ61_01900 [candidate division MSBL1 archaeon SCGC-AAA259B11]KXA95368.1 hypothetical protein AKJ36_00795 [candidate division MSBL1 archaeon SCGC-AAA259I07]